MDQKALSHLDPKARETYDRVMGAASAVESGVQPTPPPAAPTTTTADSGFVPLTPPDSSAGLSAPMPIDPGFNSGPADLSMAGMSPTPQDQPNIQPITDTPAAVPSIFSANAASPEAQNSGSSFFTNPSPSSSEPNASSSAFSALPSSFDAPADTSLATDTSSPMTPITPYTPVGTNDQMQSNGVMEQPAAQPMTPPVAVNQTAAAPGTHQSSAVLKVLYIVAAVVFFAIYTIFWIKVFNLPFLF